MNLSNFRTLAETFQSETEAFTRDAEIASWKLATIKEKAPEVYAALVAEAAFIEINVPLIAVTGEADEATLVKTWSILLSVAEDAGLGIEEFLAIT